jgi:hypothetical protein
MYFHHNFQEKSVKEDFDLSFYIKRRHTSSLTNGYCSSNQFISLSLSTKRTNDAENSRGVFARAVSTVCVDSVTAVAAIGFTGIRAGFDGATGFGGGGRRNGTGRDNRLPDCDVGGAPVLSFKKRINEKNNKICQNKRFT